MAEAFEVTFRKLEQKRKDREVSIQYLVPI